MREIRINKLPKGLSKKKVLQWIEESEKTGILFTNSYDTVIMINPQEDSDVKPNKDILDDIKE